MNRHTLAQQQVTCMRRFQLRYCHYYDEIQGKEDDVICSRSSFAFRLWEMYDFRALQHHLQLLFSLLHHHRPNTRESRVLHAKHSSYFTRCRIHVEFALHTNNQLEFAKYSCDCNKIIISNCKIVFRR